MAADKKNYIRCTGCNKPIAELDYVSDAKIFINCKCGTRNTIEAQPLKQVSGVILNGHHQGLTLGTFSIQHISEDSPELKVEHVSSQKLSTSEQP